MRSKIKIENNSIRKTKNSSQVSLCDIYFVNEDYALHIYQGGKNTNDIRLRYSRNKTLIRTPKHVHWMLDVLLKKEKYRKKTDMFVELLVKKYVAQVTLPTPSCANYEDFVKDIYTENLNKYLKLSKAGEYPIEFLYMLIILLIAQEKTNYPTGGFFKKCWKA